MSDDELTIDDISKAADVFRPVYNRTHGDDGYVSLEVSPLLSTYDMYATTYGSPAEYEQKAGQAYWIVGVDGQGQPHRCRITRAEADSFVDAATSNSNARAAMMQRCFEPSLDYVVVKVPRFAFEKFPGADPTLTTHMKSVGEAMAIGRSFPEALQKALRSLEDKKAPFDWHKELVDLDKETLLEAIKQPHDGRLKRVMDAIRAEATPLHRGKRTMVWQTRVTDDTGRVLSLTIQTQMVLA